MKLNKSSYVHVKIRKLCKQLEVISGMKLVTDLGEEFDEIRLVNRLGYIIIDYQKRTCFALSHKLTEVEMKIIDEIMVHLDFMETVGKWQNRL